MVHGGHEFKRWRKSLDLSQSEAADALGWRRVVSTKGKRDGDPVKIPRSIRLACYAIAVGVTDYHGPEGDRRRKKGVQIVESHTAS
jgi:hypothetical protein